VARRNYRQCVRQVRALIFESTVFLNRILSRLTRSITRPGQMYPVGLLFGIGFDTATEVLLLAMAGSSAAAGLPCTRPCACRCCSPPA